jgi:hypothetical protein
MKINFTNKQYEALLKLVYLGNWVANSNHVPGSKEIHASLEEVEEYVFSYAKDFGLKHFVDTRFKGKAYPSRQFDEESGVQDIIDEYDEENLWDELCDQLSRRDFHEKYSNEEIEKMDPDERMEKLYSFISTWEDEFENHGLSRLRAINMTMKTKNSD